MPAQNAITIVVLKHTAKFGGQTAEYRSEGFRGNPLVVTCLYYKPCLRDYPYGGCHMMVYLQ